MDGYVIPVGTLLPAMPILTTAVTVTIGGVAAAVTYAGAFDDGMLGVLQINATIPVHTLGPATPVVVSIGGINADPCNDRDQAIGWRSLHSMRFRRQ